MKGRECNVLSIYRVHKKSNKINKISYITAGRAYSGINLKQTQTKNRCDAISLTELLAKFVSEPLGL